MYEIYIYNISIYNIYIYNVYSVYIRACEIYFKKSKQLLISCLRHRNDFERANKRDKLIIYVRRIGVWILDAKGRNIKKKKKV